MSSMSLIFELEKEIPSDNLFTRNTISQFRSFSAIDKSTIVRLACGGCSLEVLRKLDTGDRTWAVKLSFSLGYKSSWMSLNSNKDLLCTISEENFVYLYKIRINQPNDPIIVMAAGPIRLKNSDSVIDVIWHPKESHRYLYVFKNKSVDLLTIGNEIDGKRCSIHLTSKCINKEVIGACFQPSNLFLLILLSNGTCMYLNGGDLTIVGRFRAFSNLLQRGDQLTHVVHIAGGNKIISMTESGYVVAYDLTTTQVTSIRIEKFIQERKLTCTQKIDEYDDCDQVGQIVSISGIDNRTFAISRNNSGEVAVIEIVSTKDESKSNQIELREVNCDGYPILLPLKDKCDYFDGFLVHSSID